MDAVLPLDQMTVEEKLTAMEAIWRSLSKLEDQVPVPDWHKQVLNERQRQIDAGKATFISMEEMKERVRKRTG
jgi:putative addiction module component (TIGR02574 family)